jgi:GntR family transcriptional regulator / MocR family aminotransferase
MNSPPHDLNINVTLDRAGTVPLRTQILTQLREAITAGVLAPGDPLPSSRALAANLGVSRTTVLECYLELEGDGWIHSAHGAGTFVARRKINPDIPPTTSAATVMAPESARYDLRPGGVDPALLSSADWRKIWRRAAPSATVADPVGIPELRAALAGYLGSARGLACAADEIIVCAGTAEAVTVLSAALGWPGRSVATENPGYPAIRHVLRRMAVECAPVDVTEPAEIPDRLASLPAVAGVYLTPSHQYPLGHRLDEPVRQAVIDWADRTGTVVVEDDYDGEFSFGIAPSTSMAGLAPTSNVVFVGTMSKVLDPGLRLAYLRVPPHLVDVVRRARADFGPTVPTAIQHGVAAFVTSGDLSRHIARARRVYADRRRAMLQELRALPAVVDLIGIDAGLHVVAQLSPGVDAARVVMDAHRRGIEILDLDEFRYEPQPDDPGLVFGYSAHPPAEIRAALAVLREGASQSR